LGLTLIISGIGRQFKVIEQKKLLFKGISFVDMSTSILSLLVAVVLAARGFGVYSLVYSSLVQSFTSNLVFLIMGLRKQGLQFHLSFDEAKPFLKIGGFQVGGQVVNYFNRDLDILLIGKFFSPDILGGYSLAKQLVFRPAQLINPILVKVASPALALFQHDKAALKKNYLRLVNIVTTINLPTYLGIILFAPWVVTILYGEGFDDIVLLVRILSVYMIFRAIGNPVGSLVIATGRTDLEFIWNIVTLLILPLFIYVGSQYGIVEVTIAITSAMAILYIPSWKLLINRMIGASLKEYLIASFTFNFDFLKRKMPQ